MEMHKRTCIVSLTFQLELEPYNESWRYRAQADPEFDDSWTIKFNGHERSDTPPDILPPGSLVAVFLAYGKWNERWNPKGKQAEDFVYLKIGSVLDA